MSQLNFSWSAGQILHNRYQLQQPLGHTGDRQVWLSTDLKSQPPQSVVVKLLAFHAQMQWDEFKLFEQEIAILQSLNHPQIPRYQDSFAIEPAAGVSWFALVESFIPGRSLAQGLEQGQHWTAEQLCAIATQVLMILIDLHERKPPLLHRDIKPSNLILGGDHRIYLIDFDAVQEQHGLGATSTVVGTSGYAPPEQFFGQAVPESDLYALGATLIHLLTGTAPADLPQQALQIQFRDGVSVPDALAAWIEQLTEPDPADRFPTARQALAALKAVDLTQATRSHPQPANSQIRIQKTDQFLRILMPGIGLSSQQIAAFLLQFVLLGALLFLVWTWSPETLIRLPNATAADTIGMLRFIRILATIPWVMTLFTLIKHLQQQWQPNRIEFYNGNATFSLCWRLLGFCWWRQGGPIEQMQEVSASVNTLQQQSKAKGPQPQMVLIQAGKRRYTFGAGSTEAECNWLVHEIKHWLKPNR